MKKISLALCVATSLFANADVMRPVQYTVNTTPPVSVVVSPDRIQMGGMFFKRLNLSCRSYNGIPMLAPLVISVDNTQQEIVSALKASFGADKTVSISGL